MAAFIFDFNGTMVADSALHEAAWTHYVETLCHRRIGREEFLLHVHGKPSSEILRYFLGQKEISQSDISRYSKEKEAFYRKLCREAGERFALLPGLENFLEEAKRSGIRMTIATAANWDNMQFYYERFGLERWFDPALVVCDDGSLRGKPEPDVYLCAMERLRAMPEECVVFEDAVSGVTAAYRAGAGYITGIYGDSSKEALEQTGWVHLLVPDYRGLRPDRLLGENA